MALTVVSQLNKVIYIDLYYFEEYEILAGVFACDVDCLINRIQVADEEYKARLKQMVDITFDGRRLDKIKSQLNEIPFNSKFIVLHGYFDEECFLSALKREVYKLNNFKMYTSQLSQIYELFTQYRTFSFDGEGEKVYIGERDKEKRVCRFCGKKIPEVSFSGSKSHAISEFLGNKSLICLEECNTCNSEFGKTIEPEFSRMLSPMLSMFNIKGKKGYRKTRGKNFVIEHRKPSDEKLFCLKFEYQGEVIDGVRYFDATSIKYVPQDVYKCLCKYVISLIDSKYLPYFQETINWIKSPTRYCKLPKIAISSYGIYPVPCMKVCIRMDNNYDVPYCIAVLSTCNEEYAFIVPFCNKDKYNFTTLKRCMKFKEIVRSSSPIKKWEFEDFSYSTKRPCPNSLSFKVEEGNEHYFGLDSYPSTTNENTVKKQSC